MLTEPKCNRRLRARLTQLALRQQCVGVGSARHRHVGTLGSSAPLPLSGFPDGHQMVSRGSARAE